MTVFFKSLRRDIAVLCIVGGFFVLFSILYAIEIMEFFGFEDPPNFATLIVEIGVGVLIAIVVYLISTKQQKKMEGITGDIKKILDEQQATKRRLQTEYARGILTLISFARSEIFAMKVQIKFLRRLDLQKIVKTTEQLEEEESRRKQFESNLKRLRVIMTESNIEPKTIVEIFDEQTMLSYDEMWKMFVFTDSLLHMGQNYYESLMEQFIKTGVDASEKLHEILIKHIPENQRKGYPLRTTEPS